MTSVMSMLPGRSDLPTPGVAVVLSYDEGGETVPVPFTYSNGTLDMAFTSGFTSGTSVNDNETNYLRYSPNAIHLVTTIGPNFIAWMQNAGGADTGSVSIYQRGIVVRANALQLNSQPNSSPCTDESTTPYDFEAAQGTASDNNYFTTYLFKKALVLTFTKSGTRYYRYFNTQIGEGNT